jgi:hypothetical protein
MKDKKRMKLRMGSLRNLFLDNIKNPSEFPIIPMKSTNGGKIFTTIYSNIISKPI